MRKVSKWYGQEHNDSSSTTSLQSDYRVTTYYQTFLEMRARFETNDQDILCALAGVVFSLKPSETNITSVSSFYSLNGTILEAETQIFQNNARISLIPYIYYLLNN